MKSKILPACLAALALLIIQGFDSKETSAAKITARYTAEKNNLYQAIVRLSGHIHTAETGINKNGARADLMACRLAYKKIEWIVSYYYPTIETRINGPDVMEEEEPGEFEPAHGLQVIENLLFTVNLYDSLQRSKLDEEVIRLLGNVKGLDEAIRLVSESKDGEFMAALKYELIRITTLGFTEYDNPVKKNYLDESIAALAGIEENLNVFDGRVGPSLSARARSLFQKSISFIRKHHSIEKFDRLEFITGYYLPLSRLLDEYAAALQTKYQSYSRYLNLESKSLFGLQSFSFFLNKENSPMQAARIRLGKTLFFDPILSSNLERSCASCHAPGKAFTDGRSRSLAFDPDTTVARNAPTLINVCLQTAFFDDQRERTLEKQIHSVVSNPNELNGSFPVIFSRLKGSDEYKKLFSEAFPGDSMKEDLIATSIACYERTLIGFNSRFDQYLAGDRTKLTSSQINGFNLFMGKAKCGSCHFAPMFSGMLPPFYSKPEAEVIGTLKDGNLKKPALDADEGIGALSKMEHQKFSFKVPSLRNAALTAPYMHNGSFKTLEEVVAFYNNGGAAGLGIKISNQTLPSDSLGLTRAQMQDIIHFIEALTDTSGLNSGLPSVLPKLSVNENATARKPGGTY